MYPDPRGQVRLVGVRDTLLSVDEVLGAVSDPSSGGTVIFVGTVRDADDGRGVVSLDYSAHPSAAAQLQAVVEVIAVEQPGTTLAVLHRVGSLAVGDLAVIAAVSAPHRGQAFDAGRRLIDDVKASVPIWKHQVFTDGTEEWVGLP